MSPVELHDFEATIGTRTTAWQRVAFLICGDWAAAEDIVQIGVLKLAKAWHRIEPSGLEGYARKVIARVAIDEARKPHRRAEQLSEPPERPSPSSPAEDGMDVRAALQQLPPKQRAVLVLRFYDDLTIAETARTLGITQSTVNSHAARGLQALRGYLTPATHGDLRANPGPPPLKAAVNS